MNIEPKLQKLLHLRQLRERVSSGALSNAKTDVRNGQDALRRAETEFEELQKLRFAETKVALKRAEKVKDSAARFSGIAITLQKQSVRIDRALDHIELCEDRVEAALSRTAERKADYIARQRDTQKTETLLDRAKAANWAEVAVQEEDEIAELFAARLEVRK